MQKSLLRLQELGLDPFPKNIVCQPDRFWSKFKLRIFIIMIRKFFPKRGVALRGHSSHEPWPYKILKWFWSGHTLILCVTSTFCSAEINNDDSTMLENKWQKWAQHISPNFIKREVRIVKFDCFSGLIDRGDAFYWSIYFKFLRLLAQIFGSIQQLLPRNK